VDQLARRLGLSDAVLIGLGSMLGAGVFVAYAPAAAAAGSWLLLSLLLASVVAYANATASARLAAVYPESGGTYVYGREQLSPFWGYLAGWAFVAGKLSSCAAMAWTIGVYALPDHARWVAVASVVLVAAISYRGITKSAKVTRLIVAIVVTALVVAAAMLIGIGPTATTAGQAIDVSVAGVLSGAGFLFFAFAGYARIATLGEEVIEPERTIPRAIPIALAIVTGLYALVAIALLRSRGAEVIATDPAPLAGALRATGLAATGGLVRPGDAVQVLLTANPGKADSQTTVILPRVTVYDAGYEAGSTMVGTTGAGGTRGRVAEPGPLTWLTLLVTQDQAVQLVQAKWNGELDVALLPPAE